MSSCTTELLPWKQLAGGREGAGGNGVQEGPGEADDAGPGPALSLRAVRRSDVTYFLSLSLPALLGRVWMARPPLKVL